jgi:hypothetical protein
MAQKRGAAHGLEEVWKMCMCKWKGRHIATPTLRIQLFFMGGCTCVSGRGGSFLWEAVPAQFDGNNWHRWK